MRDLPAVREWIECTVAKYYQQLHITKIPVPIILYGLKDAPKGVKSDSTAKKYKQFAAVSLFNPSNFKKPSYIVLNLPWHKSITVLEDTIVHELLHMRFPKMDCDDYQFYKLLGMALMGKTFRDKK